MVRCPHLFPPDAYGLLRSGAEIAEGVEKVGVAEAPHGSDGVAHEAQNEWRHQGGEEPVEG